RRVEGAVDDQGSGRRRLHAVGQADRGGKALRERGRGLDVRRRTRVPAVQGWAGVPNRGRYGQGPTGLDNDAERPGNAVDGAGGTGSTGRADGPSRQALTTWLRRSDCSR